MTGWVLLSDDSAAPKPTPLTILTACQFLWHPALVRDAAALPGLGPADERTLDHDQAVVPVAQASDDPWRLGPVTRPVADLAAWAGRHELPEIDEDVLLDFYALGYARFAVDVLTEEMDYAPLTDAERLLDSVRGAAEAWFADDRPTLRRHLDNAFGCLREARQQAYPATIHVLDVGLTRPGMADAAARRLRTDQPINVVATGDWLLGSGGDLRDALIAAGAHDRVEVLTGVMNDDPVPLLSLGSRVWHLKRSAKAVAEVLHVRPDTFGSRAMNLAPDLPCLLQRAGMRYALHAAFGAGAYPHFRIPKIHWTGIDGASVEAVSRDAVDATDESAAVSVLAHWALSARGDRSPLLVLAHWLDAGADWYRWMLRCQARGEVFGRFQRCAEYFLHSVMADGATTTKMEEYTPPEQVPSRSWSGQRWPWERATALQALARILKRPYRPEPFVKAVVDSEDEIERNPSGRSLGRMERASRAAAQAVAAVAMHGATGDRDGVLLVNPNGVRLRVPLRRHTRSGKWLVGHDAQSLSVLRALDDEPATGACMTVDLPPLGFAWQPTAAEAQPSRPVVSGNRLTGSLVQVRLDPKRAELTIEGAGARRLTLRLSHGDQPFVADRPDRTADSDGIAGTLVRHCTLANGREVLLRVTVWRDLPTVAVGWSGSTGSTGKERVTCRWQWPDAKSPLTVPLGYADVRQAAERFQAPLWWQVAARQLHTTVDTGGQPPSSGDDVPWRRVGPAELACGSRPLENDFLISLDLPQPFGPTLGRLRPPVVVPVTGTPVRASGWFCRVEPAGVLCWSLEPDAASENTVVMSLQETAGRATEATLMFCRSVVAARIVEWDGRLIYDLYPGDGEVAVDLAPREVLRVEIDLL